MIANKKGELMKKADIVKYLSERDAEGIRLAINHIKDNEELQRVKNFDDYCKFILKKIDEESELKTDKEKMRYRGVYDGFIKKVRIIIENHGLPRKGHLDDQANQIIHTIESDAYRHLLEIYPAVRESYLIVRNHTHEPKHALEYEKRLNHLKSALTYEQAERNLEAKMKSKLNLVEIADSA